jgi:hypothetical protein
MEQPVQKKSFFESFFGSASPTASPPPNQSASSDGIINSAIIQQLKTLASTVSNQPAQEQYKSNATAYYNFLKGRDSNRLTNVISENNSVREMLVNYGIITNGGGRRRKAKSCNRKMKRRQSRRNRF